MHFHRSPSILSLLLPGAVVALLLQRELAQLSAEEFSDQNISKALDPKDPSHAVSLYRLLSHPLFDGRLCYDPSDGFLRDLASTLQAHFVKVSSEAVMLLFPASGGTCVEKSLDQPAPRPFIEGRIFGRDQSLPFTLAQPALSARLSWTNPSALLELLQAPQRQRMVSAKFCRGLAKSSEGAELFAQYHGLSPQELGPKQAKDGPFWMLLDSVCLGEIEKQPLLQLHKAMLQTLTKQPRARSDLFFVFRALSVETALQIDGFPIRKLVSQESHSSKIISAMIIFISGECKDEAQRRAYDKVREIVSTIIPDMQSTLDFELVTLFQSKAALETKATDLLEKYSPEQVPPYIGHALFQNIEPGSIELPDAWSKVLSSRINADGGHFPVPWFLSLQDVAFSRWRRSRLRLITEEQRNRQWPPDVDLQVRRFLEEPENLFFGGTEVFINEHMPEDAVHSLEKVKEFCRGVEQRGMLIQCSPLTHLRFSCAKDDISEIVQYFYYRVRLVAVSGLGLFDGDDVAYGQFPQLSDGLVELLYHRNLWAPLSEEEISSTCINPYVQQEQVKSLVGALRDMAEKWEIPRWFWRKGWINGSGRGPLQE